MLQTKFNEDQQAIFNKSTALREGGCGGVGVGTGDGLVVSSKYQSNLIINKEFQQDWDQIENFSSNTHGKFRGSGSLSMKSAEAVPKYGSGHKSARQTDGRTTPKQYPSAYGGG
ncbi:hypothetical protein DPMN_113678 [Dreissena polymorpha]|uniref:Uncharacterized protein n=1 Tax=Dreissena polymorpha TaxID=45954 RepID=A0A9D4KID6_DREPO|nr:hypothetical protein DPMN_113678 [Dreissena polymorpha]